MIVFVFFFLIFGAGSVFAPAARAEDPQKPLMLMIPGVTNRLMGRYFSENTQKALREQGFDVVVASELIPFGNVEVNGKRVAKILDDNCRPGRTWVFAHSAGALFALSALASSQCRISGLSTFAAPLQGAELAGFFLLHPFWGRFWLTALAITSRWSQAWPWTDVRIFQDFLPENLSRFYKSCNPLPYWFPWYTYAGEQPRPPTWRSSWDARYLSPPLAVVGRLLRKPNDGLVTTESAFAESLRLPTREGKELEPRAQKPAAHLDHVEQVASVLWSGPFYKNRNEVKAEQFAFYARVGREAYARLTAGRRGPFPVSE